MATPSNPDPAEPPTRDPGSFRDPSGFIFRRGGRVFRQLNQRYRDDYESLVSSGLYDQLAQDGLLVQHEEVSEPPLEPATSYRVLAPEQIPFISYPYEWSFGQLRDAALATLEIQEKAVERGMSLRDASPFNMQFLRGRPILIDTSSFERMRAAEPWVAYQQFCRSFLAPLALAACVDVRLMSLLASHLDGVPLDLASRLMPLRSRLRPGMLMHLHAHALAQKKVVQEEKEVRATPFSARALRGLLDSLRSATESLSWKPEGAWVAYYSDNNYDGASIATKEALLKEFLASTRGGVIWDLGANTGRFSRLAAAQEESRLVLSIDQDRGAVEVNYQTLRREDPAGVLPLVGDLSSPTPGLGWAGAERRSLAARGPADVLLALALIHHLAIGNNTPLAAVAEYFSRLGRQLIVEFVPKADSQVQRMLSTREDIFDSYNAGAFEAAFSRYFRVERRESIAGTSRTLYLMSRR